jgi:putative transposase
MTTASDSPAYTDYRFPAEIISHAVWLYFRFSLSYRDAEELMAAQAIVLTYETVRQWCRKFGQQWFTYFTRAMSPPKCWGCTTGSASVR